MLLANSLEGQPSFSSISRSHHIRSSIRSWNRSRHVETSSGPAGLDRTSAEASTSEWTISPQATSKSEGTSASSSGKVFFHFLAVHRFHFTRRIENKFRFILKSTTQKCSAFEFIPRGYQEGRKRQNFHLWDVILVQSTVFSAMFLIFAIVNRRSSGNKKYSRTE